MDIIQEHVVLCRACVVECTQFKSLYNYKFKFNGKQKTYAELLNFIADIELSEYESPSLPQYICNNCIQQLKEACIFRKKVLDADELLKFELEEDGIDRNTDQKKTDVKNEDVLDEEASNSNFSSYSNISEDSQPHSDVNITTAIEIEQYHIYDKTDDPLSHYKEDENTTSEVPETAVDDEYEEDESRIEFESDLDEDAGADTETNKIEERRKARNAQMLFESEREIRLQNSKQNIENPLEINSYGDKVRAYVKENKSHSQCNICGKRFVYKSSYKYHMQFHFDERKCHICNEILKTYNEYLGHISTHVPNECKTCGKSYRHASSLRSHMKTHTGEIEIINCQLCTKSFNKKWNFQQHMLTHQKRMLRNCGEEETPYKCEYCGRAYSIEANLNYHRRKHCEMFKCVLCFQIFSTSKTLKDHMKLHPPDY